MPKEHLVIDEYLPLWKGRLSFCIYIPSERDFYTAKIFMLCKSETEYLLNCTFALEQLKNTQIIQSTYSCCLRLKRLSVVILSLFYEHLNKGYLATLHNYFSSPEVPKLVLVNNS